MAAKRNIQIGADLSAEIAAVLSAPNTFVITDDTVRALFLNDCAAPLFSVAPGEDSKAMGQAERIVAEMLRVGCNRKTTVVAVGGGVVGDLAGFCAAIFMRGVRWINIPTTLLSQVDSSVGGKTAVNVGRIKNCAGCFHAPDRVLISAHFLKTLDAREWLCGIGEIVKTAFLSKPVFTLFEREEQALANREDEAVIKVVGACVRYKSDIVRRDFYEKIGIRKALNLGHTVGHAFESADSAARSHGEYVLIGLYLEALMFRDEMPAAVFAVLIKTVRRYLTSLPDVTAEAACAAAKMDKKNDGGVSVITLTGIGKPIERMLPTDEFETRLSAVLKAEREGESWKSNR